MATMDNNDVVDTLNGLIETSRDGENGFRQCAEHVQGEDLRMLMTQRADECARAVEELAVLVRNYGGTPEDTGSATGAMHRGWVAVKDALSGRDNQALLDECERGEDAAKSAYRDALEQPLPSDAQQVVSRQFQGVLRNHDQIKALRNARMGKSS